MFFAGKLSEAKFAGLVMHVELSIARRHLRSRVWELDKIASVEYPSKNGPPGLVDAVFLKMCVGGALAS